MAQVLETVLRTFAVLLGNRARVDAALEALNKRAARKGLPLLAWSWGKAYRSTVTKEFPFLGLAAGYGVPFGCNVVGQIRGGEAVLAEVPCERIDLTLPVDVPRYAGWRFVAALQHLEGENLVRSLPGEDLPTVYRSRGPVCDHCKHDRRRNDTYVLAHEDGRTIQVGSTCIGDFLGTDLAGKLASSASILAAARGIAEEGCEGFGGGSAHDRLLADYLPYVAWCVRSYGWTSRTVAREQGGQATADTAWTLLTSEEERRKAKCELSADDTALAASAESWAESLTDAAVDAERGDYLHNLRAVARTGLATSRTAGIAASAVTAYQRHIGKERAKATIAALPKADAFVGTVGDKVCFGTLNASFLKKDGTPKKGAPTVLSADPVTLEFVTGYETQFGYTTVVKFRTTDGACLVWKASSTEIGRDDVGKKFTLYGTIKAHDTYKDAKQTILTRCAVHEIKDAAASDAA